MKLPGSTLQEAADNLAKLKSWSPFRFAGKWFLVETPAGIEAFRTKKAAENCCRRHGINAYSVTQ